MTRSVKQMVMYGSERMVLKQENRSTSNALLENIGWNSVAAHIRKEKESIMNNRLSEYHSGLLD
jgi:hypothetical protein